MQKKWMVLLGLYICMGILLAGCGAKDTSLQQNSTDAQASTEALTPANSDTQPATSTTEASANASSPTTPSKAPTQTKVTTTKAPTTRPTTTLPTPLPPANTPIDAVAGSLKKNIAQKMLTRVNKERADAGLSTLSLDDTLCEDAQVRAQEIAVPNCFSHTRPDGSRALTVIRGQFSYAGENIAYGQKNVTEVMDAWMDSSGHRENILRPEYSALGTACFETADGTLYWVQLFKG